MAKMKQCKVCSKEIASNAKRCPGCGAKNSKAFYKKWWFWLIIIIIFIGSIGGKESSNTSANNTNKQEISESQKPVEKNTEVQSNEKVPAEYKSALKKAKLYSDTMYMSKEAIYDQLTSEYGEKFSKEAAKYAIDNVKANWNENALKKAQTYQKDMAMSPNAIYDQLTSEYGEKFTAEEAQYAIDNLN